MKLISHRGNLSGQNQMLENNPDYIMDAYKAGFDVEIDVWNLDGDFYLGHDNPDFKIDWEFLTNSAFWCHAKNFEALYRMRLCGAHCFWHEQDDYTLTSKSYIWTYPGKTVSSESVVVCKTKDETIKVSKKRLYGICSDYVEFIK